MSNIPNVRVLRNKIKHEDTHSLFGADLCFGRRRDGEPGYIGGLESLIRCRFGIRWDMGSRFHIYRSELCGVGFGSLA